MIKIIEKYICSRRNISPELLHERNDKGKLTRFGKYVLARQLIVYYAMENGYTERDASAFYYQNHATAHHTKNKINFQRDIYSNFRDEMNEYDEKLKRLTKLTYKELINKLPYGNHGKIELIKEILPTLEAELLAIEDKINDIKSIISDLKNELRAE